jgi:uncharacterized protein
MSDLGAVTFPMKKVAEICRHYQVRELAVFGSALRSDFNQASDIDLLVEFQPGARIGLLALGELATELSSVVGRKVDLVPKRGLKPAIREEVLSQAKTLYAA